MTIWAVVPFRGLPFTDTGSVNDGGLVFSRFDAKAIPDIMSLEWSISRHKTGAMKMRYPVRGRNAKEFLKVCCLIADGVWDERSMIIKTVDMNDQDASIPMTIEWESMRGALDRMVGQEKTTYNGSTTANPGNWFSRWFDPVINSGTKHFSSNFKYVSAGNTYGDYTNTSIDFADGQTALAYVDKMTDLGLSTLLIRNDSVDVNSGMCEFSLPAFYDTGAPFGGWPIVSGGDVDGSLQIDHKNTPGYIYLSGLTPYPGQYLNGSDFYIAKTQAQMLTGCNQDIAYNANLSTSTGQGILNDLRSKLPGLLTDRPARQSLVSVTKYYKPGTKVRKRGYSLYRELMGTMVPEELMWVEQYMYSIGSDGVEKHYVLLGRKTYSEDFYRSEALSKLTNRS